MNSTQIELHPSAQFTACRISLLVCSWFIEHCQISCSCEWLFQNLSVVSGSKFVELLLVCLLAKGVLDQACVFAHVILNKSELSLVSAVVQVPWLFSLFHRWILALSMRKVAWKCLYRDFGEVLDSAPYKWAGFLVLFQDRYSYQTRVLRLDIRVALLHSLTDQSKGNQVVHWDPWCSWSSLDIVSSYCLSVSILSESDCCKFTLKAVFRRQQPRQWLLEFNRDRYV